MNHFYSLQESAQQEPLQARCAKQADSHTKPLLHEQIAKAAYYKWLQNTDSDALLNWLTAERELASNENL